MKKIIIVCTLPLFLNASYIHVRQYANKHQDEKVLKEAKKSFEDYKNPKLHLLWAKSAQRLGKITEAMAAYERVLILDPVNKEATEALQKIYFQTHRTALLNTSAPRDTKNKFNAKASFALGYDNNVNVNAGGDALDGYYGVDLGFRDIASYFLKTTANISYLYQFKENNHWFIQTTLDTYYQNNFNAHTYDLRIPTLELALGYSNKNYLFYLPVSYNAIHYLNKNLLNQLDLTPRVRVNLSKDTFWDVAFIYSKRNYIQTIDKTKNATTLGLETALYTSSMNTQTKLDISWEKRNADDTLGDRYVDANFLNLHANMKYNFTPSLYTHIDYLFRYANYKDDIGTRETPSNISRDDYVNEIDLKLSYIFNKDMEIYAQNTYTYSLSTYIPAEYKKNITLLGFQVRY